MRVSQENYWVCEMGAVFPCATSLASEVVVKAWQKEMQAEDLAMAALWRDLSLVEVHGGCKQPEADETRSR